MIFWCVRPQFCIQRVKTDILHFFQHIYIWTYLDKCILIYENAINKVDMRPFNQKLHVRGPVCVYNHIYRYPQTAHSQVDQLRWFLYAWFEWHIYTQRISGETGSAIWCDWNINNLSECEFENYRFRTSWNCSLYTGVEWWNAYTIILHQAEANTSRLRPNWNTFHFNETKEHHLAQWVISQSHANTQDASQRWIYDASLLLPHPFVHYVNGQT